ncbi:MAG: AtpZ/AtpI family protein [Bacteroidales bacterium]
MEKKKSTPNNRSQNQKKKNPDPSGLKSWTRYSGLGFQMIAIILLFYWAGSKLDERAATEKPVYTAVLTVLGVFAGLYIVLKDFIGRGND